MNAVILWNAFDLAGFQIRKPFTTAIKGLNIMVPEMISAVISAFFKKLYLEVGLVSTREQVVFAVLGEMFRHPQFSYLKEMLIIFLKRDLKQMQPALTNVLQLINSF